MRRFAVCLLAAVGCLVGPVPAADSAPVPSSTVCTPHDPRLTEASGIARGVASPGVLYVQNDSGDTNRVFALNARTCRTAATLTIRGATNVDWEDLAIARDASGRSSLWIADTGNNAADRSTVTVYRVPEPRLDADARDAARTVDVAETFRLRYPAQTADTESLAVAPGGRAYLVTKSPLGRSYVFALPARGGDTVQVLRKIGNLQLTPVGQSPFGLPGALAATGAALSPDGSQLVLRTYSGAFLWSVRDGDVAAALRTTPRTEALPHQRQGEGVAFDGSDGRRLLLDSEGAGTPVLAVPIPGAAGSSAVGSRTGEAAQGASASSSSPRSTSPSGSASATTAGKGSGGSWWPGVVVLVLVVAGSIAWWTFQRSGSPGRRDR